MAPDDRAPAATSASKEALEESSTEDGPLRTWPKSSEDYERARAKAAAEAKTEAEIKAKARHDQEEDDDADEAFFLRRGYGRFNLGGGYVFSNWSGMSPELKNGSLAFFLGGSRQYSRRIEGGLSFMLLNGSDNSRNEENIYAITVNIDTRWFMLTGRIKPYAGLSLGFGSFRAWSLRSETPTSVIYAKHAGGYLIGATPSLGVRIQTFPWLALDVATVYNAYFTSASRKAGGLGILTTLSLTRN